MSHRLNLGMHFLLASTRILGAASSNNSKLVQAVVGSTGSLLPLVALPCEPLVVRAFRPRDGAFERVRDRI